MARYTLNLSEVCEQMSGLNFNDLDGNAFDRIDTIANAAIPNIFSNRIELLDDGADKLDLERMILEHYWEYEICTYTPSDFILRLNRKLNEIAPYYNKRYESTKLEFPVFDDVKYDETGEDSATNNTKDNTTDRTVNSGTDTTTDQESGTTGVVNAGSDVTTDQESGTTKLTNSHNDTTNTSGTMSGESDDDSSTGNIVPMKTDWDYQNDTPQNSISGITEGDYLTKYSKHTTSMGNSNINNNPGSATDMNGNTYDHDTSISGTNGGAITKNQTHTASKTNGNETNNGGHIDTTEHGKGNKSTLQHGHTSTTSHGRGNLNTLLHGHQIDNTGNKTSDFKHDGDYSKHVEGKLNSGRSYSEMLNLYRSTMINIYQEIIDELKELFFIIY